MPPGKLVKSSRAGPYASKRVKYLPTYRERRISASVEVVMFLRFFIEGNIY